MAESLVLTVFLDLQDRGVSRPRPTMLNGDSRIVLAANFDTQAVAVQGGMAPGPALVVAKGIPHLRKKVPHHKASGASCLSIRQFIQVVKFTIPFTCTF